MKKNLVQLVDAILQNSSLLTDANDSGPSFDILTSNSALLSDSLDNGLSFDSLSTNMPEASIRLTYNLWYRQLFQEDVLTSESFFRKVWFHRLFNEEIESVDSIAKLHEPITLDPDFFFIDDLEFDTKLIRGNRYLELLYVSENFFSPKSVSPKEKVYIDSNSFAKEWGEDLGIEEAFADSTQIELLPFRGRTYRDYAFADEDILIAANSALLWDRYFASDNYTSKNANAVVNDVAYFNFTEDDFTLVHGQNSSLEEILFADSILNPFWSYASDTLYTGNEDTFFTQGVHLSELRSDRDPSDPNDFAYSSDEFFSLPIKEVADSFGIKEFLKNPKWAGLLDRIFETDSSYNSPNLRFISKKATTSNQLGQDRKGEELWAMAGGYGTRHLRALNNEGLVDELRLPKYNIEPFYVPEVHGKDWSLVSFNVDKNILEPVLITAKSGQVIYGRSQHLLDRFFLEDKDDELLVHKIFTQNSADTGARKTSEEIFFSGDRSNDEDIYFHVNKASILEDYFLKDKIINVANSSSVRTDKAFAKTEEPEKKHSIWKMLPQEFFPKSSNLGGLRTKTGIYHSLYSSSMFTSTNSNGTIKHFFPTGSEASRAGEAPWEDYVTLGSDGGGPWYLESSYGPQKYRWVQTQPDISPDIGYWLFSGYHKGFGSSGSRRTNFYIRPPVGSERTTRYTPFTGTPYIVSYANGRLLNSGIIALGLNKFTESFAYAKTGQALAALSTPMLRDNFYAGFNPRDSEYPDVRIEMEYGREDFIELFQNISKAQKLLLTLEEIKAKTSSPLTHFSLPLLFDAGYWGNDTYEFILRKYILNDTFYEKDFNSYFLFKEYKEQLFLNSSLHNAAKFVPIKDNFFFQDYFDSKNIGIQVFDEQSTTTLKHTAYSKESLIRALNRLTPETSPVINDGIELSTKVNYIRNEIYQDTINVKGTQEDTISRGISLSDVNVGSNNYRSSYTEIVSVPLDIQNLLEDPSVLSNYSINKITLFGDAGSNYYGSVARPSTIKIKAEGEEYNSYSFAENSWKGGDTLKSSDPLVLIIEIPYVRKFNYSSRYWSPAVENFSIKLDLTVNFTGGNIELTGRPSEYPFVNNVQYADSGSAFINNYCLEYFYEAYVGEEGTYANF